MMISVFPFLLVLLSLCLCVPLVSSITLTPPISTSAGPVQGYVSPINSTHSLSIFRSIPFAAPPVGPRRFRRSVPPEPWNNTLRALTEQHACPQFAITKNLFLGSEDCLTLNVYAPTEAIPQPNLDQPTAALRPVFVWFYGGAFILGSKNEFGFYDATRIAAAHGYVFVAVNYRLGSLGFLSLPGLAAEDARNATGNWGLLDQQLGLDWVQSNIAQFGGDPNQVTIFGESAGAFSVCWHLAAPGSRNRFRAAILESATCDSRFFYSSRDQSFEFGTEFAKMLGCDGTKPIVDCLRSLPAGALISPLLGSSAASHTASELPAIPDWQNWKDFEFDSISLEQLNEWNNAQPRGSHPKEETRDNYVLLDEYLQTLQSHQTGSDSASSPFLHRLKQMSADQAGHFASSPFLPALFPAFPWGPTIDGVECLDLPVNRFLAGEVNRWNNSSLTVILGTNLNEGTIFVPVLYTLQALQWKLHLPLQTSDLPLILNHFFPYADVPKQVLQYYELNTPRNTSFLGPTRIASHIIRDYMFFCSSRRAALALNAIPGVRTYVYQFDYIEDFLEFPLLGDSHMSEVEFVFANPFPPFLHIFSQKDWTMAGIMGSYWANLVWSGKSPNSQDGSSLLHWPAFEPTNRTTMILHLQPSTTDRLWYDTCEMWDSVFHTIEQNQNSTKSRL